MDMSEGMLMVFRKAKNSASKEGLARGTTEGAQAKQRDIAANMLTMGMDIPVIAKATGLSEQDISKLKQTDTLK